MFIKTIKPVLTVASALTLAFTVNAFASDAITGLWQTTDEDSGQPKSHVRITKEGDTYVGKIEKLLIKPENDVCTKCDGALKDQPLIGLQIISGLQADGDTTWEGGRIVNPENGKDYKLKASLDGNDTLNIRGSIGPIGKTQVWTRVE